MWVDSLVGEKTTNYYMYVISQLFGLSDWNSVGEICVNLNIMPFIELP